MIKRGLQLLFRKRDFGLLMGTQFFAQAGDGIFQATVAKTVAFGGQKGFDLEGASSPQEILTIALYIFVPYTILSPFLGVVIDRWDRRRLLLFANGLRAVVVAVLGLVGIDALPDAALFGAFLLTLSSTRVVLATKSAALPETVDGDELMEANAVSQLGGALFQLGGAGVALIAADMIDAEPIVIAGALVYAVGAFLAARVQHVGEVREKSTLGAEIGRVVRNIGAGFKEVSETPKAAAAITSYFWLRLLWSFSLAGIALVVRDLIGEDDMLSVVITGGAAAGGAVLGFMFASKLRGVVKSTAVLVLLGAALGGGAVTALGALEMKATIAVLMFFLGFGFFLAKISLDTLVQEAIGDDFRGRAFSLYDIAYNLAWVLAAGALKIFWADMGSASIALMGGVFLIGLAGLSVWYRKAGLLEAVRAGV